MKEGTKREKGKSLLYLLGNEGKFRSRTKSLHMGKGIRKRAIKKKDGRETEERILEKRPLICFPE